MINLTQIAAICQSIYHLIFGPILLVFSNELFNYPLFYTFLRQDMNVFKPTHSDTEFLSILGGIFFFIGFVFFICIFSNKRTFMIIISSAQIMLHSQMVKFLKTFKEVSYILAFTRSELILGILTATLVIIDFIISYPREREEEKKRHDKKVAELKKQYGIKDEDINKKNNSKDEKKDKKNN
ncbi:hypothetical protein BCR32DRAFT_293247 [Anaeromyces robustus]|uniref:Uncharacterized protein n=1 Tax=Anaeromyces robustus TaxID=1754192 RepID=A0A1Y1X704_9FUNG|nr:hypothetical protein BCR32DRAFT_293247 [Anaeromyces robustus]|eukprot:ORX81505.1 hypothetical protein BCR32DRAFT_293247 [Anaeromyces robustus]